MISARIRSSWSLTPSTNVATTGYRYCLFCALHVRSCPSALNYLFHFDLNTTCKSHSHLRVPIGVLNHSYSMTLTPLWSAVILSGSYTFGCLRLLSIIRTSLIPVCGHRPRPFHPSPRNPTNYSSLQPR